MKKLSNDELRLTTWLIMDGCLVKRNDKTHHLQFKLSKERKIKSLRNLLDRMDYAYTYKICKKSGLNKLQPYYIRIYGKFARRIGDEILLGIKQFPEYFLNLSKNQLKIIMAIISITDASRQYVKYRWTTTSENDFNFVHTMCCMYGIKNTVHDYKLSSGFINSKKQYMLGYYL